MTENHAKAPENENPLQRAERRRAERAAAAQAASDEQKAIDLEAIMALEDELGASNVTTVEIGHTPGLPVLLAVRCPAPIEVKRYQDRIKPKAKRDGSKEAADPTEATIEVGHVCLVYPEAGDLRTRTLESRPGVIVQLGTEALKLALGVADSEGKG